MLRPNTATQMTTPMMLQKPVTKTEFGVSTKAWEDVGKIFVNFKTYGGTESVSNDVLSVIDTAQITTWFRPDIKSDCRLVRLEDGAAYEILGEPEDLEGRHQIHYFKVRRVKGGA